jgi:hypothetical protein
MKVKKAPLIFHDFFVLDTKYKFNEPEKGKINIRELFDSYELDFDFMAKEQEDGEIFLFTKIHINEIENPLPGYIIFLEGLSIFSFDETVQLSEKEISDYIYVSGLSICINNIRTYLTNTTSSYPFGKYQLPAIDVGELHKDKAKIEKKKSKK